jgi:hypothetical protein
VQQPASFFDHFVGADQYLVSASGSAAAHDCGVFSSQIINTTLVNSTKIAPIDVK